ncbi:TetR/AcrR family transcriptional regulator [Streptomyces sp. NPDC059740]|uniref:TetR/AcrR family transcriptional regulator n=1 Tax=Streptomyces sp. NPDC059740 TaxID=3346926 RepID=UPI003654BEB2
MSEGFKRRAQSRLGEGAALKEDILRAAARLLMESGREGDLSLRAIAREVGISAPSIYLHFQDRAELVQELTRRAFARLADELRDAWEQGEGTEKERTQVPEQARGQQHGPEAALRAMAHRYCHFALDNPKIYRLMFGIQRIEVPREQASSHPLWLVYERWAEAVAACRVGRGSEADDERVAKLLWSALHGLVAMAMAVPFPVSRRQMVQSADDYLELALSR